MQFRKFNEATGERGPFADWRRAKGGIDAENSSGQRLVIASLLKRLGGKDTRWD